MIRLYSRATPYIQLIGWFFMIIPVAYSACSLIQDARAFDTRIAALEADKYTTNQSLALVNQKMDIMMNYFEIPKKR